MVGAFSAGDCAAVSFAAGDAAWDAWSVGAAAKSVPINSGVGILATGKKDQSSLLRLGMPISRRRAIACSAVGKFCINSAFIMRPRLYLASSIQS